MRPDLGNYDRAGTFQASDAPLLVVDTDLVIRDVNPAYPEVTARSRRGARRPATLLTRTPRGASPAPGEEGRRGQHHKRH